MLRGLGTPYTLGEAGADGFTFDLPDDFFKLSPQQQEAWILNSNLSAEQSAQFEDELGFDFSAITPPGYDTSIRTARQLTQAISNSASGVISVPKASSAFIIASQNSGILGGFSVQQDPLNPLNYLISSGGLTSGLALGGGVGVVVVLAIVAAVVLSKR